MTDNDHEAAAQAFAEFLHGPVESTEEPTTRTPRPDHTQGATGRHSNAAPSLADVLAADSYADGQGNWRPLNS